MRELYIYNVLLQLVWNKNTKPSRGHVTSIKDFVYVHIFHPIFVREGFFKNVTEDFHREIGRLEIYEIDIQSSPVIAYGHVMGM